MWLQQVQEGVIKVSEQALLKYPICFTLKRQLLLRFKKNQIAIRSLNQQRVRNPKCNTQVTRFVHSAKWGIDFFLPWKVETGENQICPFPFCPRETSKIWTWTETLPGWMHHKLVVPTKAKTNKQTNKKRQLQEISLLKTWFKTFAQKSQKLSHPVKCFKDLSTSGQVTAHYLITYQTIHLCAKIVNRTTDRLRWNDIKRDELSNLAEFLPLSTKRWLLCCGNICQEISVNRRRRNYLDRNQAWLWRWLPLR